MHAVLDNLWFGTGLLVVASATTALARWAGVRVGWLPVWALTRAAVQLSVIALLLRGILTVPGTVVGFVALMLTTASLTSAGRLAGLWHGRRVAVTGVLTGAATSLALVFALGLVDLQVRYVVAVAGIVIGNCMNAATLAGRNFLRAAQARRDEVEAWFSLGGSPTQAHREIGQSAAYESVLPNLDQTKATGLVTLPGAFVGALFGGAGPIDAAKFQLVVLAGIALAMTVTAVVVVRLAGRTPHVVTGPRE